MLWIVDTKKEHLAVDEAKKLNIPVVAILDTNCDPDEVDFPIPGNDDAIRSVNLLTRVVADAVAEGLIARNQRATGTTEAPEEPLAEWERELLEGSKAEEAPAAAGSPQAAEAPAAELRRREAPAAAEAPGCRAPAAEARQVNPDSPALSAVPGH